ncbi:MAG: hypothetical protein GZ093_05730 [Rhodoferax sp.]|uniref:hypothetical protein n=1 Tax=Rhodoferax sp. TaxID=50421 RepID=UPI0014012558|nr:hypothetical protein [Rhodoferax sp.]NDP38238.1 hypothetical protein [Rhodoferax sp.]
MDRREFVVGTVAGASALTFPACWDGIGNAATTSSTAAQPEPLEFRQFQTWDGGSGPSRAFWSRKLLLPWANPGRGDWLDAKQASQGGVPYAAGKVSLGPIGLDVTSLVNRWVSSGVNRGFYLRSGESWAFTFAGRTHSVVRARPQLLVVSSSGTKVIECSCNAMWSPSTYQSKDSRGTFMVARGSWFAALQFDISLITEPVLNATLSLTCLSLKNAGTLDIFELNPPEFRNGAVTLMKRSGLADKFPFDRGLSAHPSVVFAGDFSDISKKRWQTGGVVATTSQVKDPNTGSTYLRGLIPRGETVGCTLERTIVGGTSAGVPVKTETELYGRYYVFLEEDWGSEIDANKMPGWDGRFGWWSSTGHWENTTGNGGSRPTGLKVRNAKANRWEYEGASMRGHGGTRSNDGNPYDDLFWIGSYMYHLDQEGPYGESIRWPGIVVGKGRWYCIEQYIKMNSIAGPFDGTGNGVAIKDGEYRVWVDGVQAYERTNFRWRRHPEMGIQGFWLNWYHGGMVPAPRNMHFRMDAVVIARSYIGPRNERL